MDHAPSKDRMIAAEVASLPPAVRERWNERAAIREYEGGTERAKAELLALQDVARMNWRK